MHHEAMAGAPAAVHFLWLIPALPLLGTLFNVFLGRRAGRRAVGLIAPGVVGAAFLVACYAIVQLVRLPPGAALLDTAWPWITAGTLQVDGGVRLGALFAVMG